MEAGEGSGALKRQRAALSDSEDNAWLPPGSDGQKRRRVEPAGRENRSPEASSSGRLAGLQTRAEPPTVPSVRSRVQLLTRRQDGGAPLAQRCLSDPGANSPTVFNEKRFNEHFLGAGEFHQRLERFKVPTFEGSVAAAKSPDSPPPRTCGLVSGLQQKLQCSLTPSSQQASRIREERRRELSQLQPICENAWLKRSNSDPSLSQQIKTPTAPHWVPPSPSIRGLQWHPKQPWDADDDAKIKDGSFIASGAEKNPPDETEAHVADKDLAEVDQGPENKELVEEETKGKAEIGERSKKVTFLLEADVLGEATLTESIAPMGSSTRTIRGWWCEWQKMHLQHLGTNACTWTFSQEVSCHDEKNSADSLDQMFEEVFEHVDRMEEGGGGGEDDHDSSVGAEMKTEPEEQTTQQEPEKTKNCEDIEEELLTFPPSGILSPLSKSVEAVVTPLRLTVSQEASHLPSHPAESAPLYSVDAYRTQRRTKNPTVQSAPPDARRAPQKPPAPVDSKEKITALNEEAGKLQTVISQTMQALSCCTDEVHGRGSLEEAEAEKLLLVSCEKRSALLAEITRLRDERSSGEASGEDSACVDQQPCRGTVGITNIRLPLKLEFVCSSHNRPGRPSHYFFVLIRYGPCSIAATPLATAADAQNGDTISFPTSVTLKDIRSSFEIDVEVYSLSHTSASCPLERPTTRSRVTPRKLLNTITRSSNGMASAAAPLNSRRSSTFCLVGSHKITLASLGLSKFPLDKMKLDGKIRRLLGDEFQEKVPFLSPLEGHIYLQLDSKSHSLVHHQGFLTMFELISGFGVWNRRYFVLKECTMYYWNHPNDEGTKEAENSIALSDCYQSVRAVQRDLCARPFTFELVSARPPQQDGGDQALARFSADTKQERLDWMEKLSQVLLDFHTWNPRSAAEAQGGQSGGGVREGGRA
ncbi:anillin, actin binding protein 2, partial [Takifugu rubripes]|uniref:anillin, actin binding protein 2 n=1 Tax=Takifugu rubripes TaxID=31033 RepID=UPI0011452C81